MAETEDLRQLGDEELIVRYQEMKTEGSGDDRRLVPTQSEQRNALERELERRGLAPDREDVIPTTDAGEDGDPMVRDQA